MKEDFITGLDIGSTMIRMMVGQRVENPQGEPKLHIIGFAQVPSQGVSKGVITSIDDAVSAITQCLEKLERMIGVPIEHTWVGISGGHIISQESKGVIAVSKSDGEIGDDDIDRVIEAARTVAMPQNYEILHVIPKNFVVDGQTGIKDPVGMTGVRLEVDAQIIQGLSSQIKNLTKCIYRTGVDIDDIVLSILACGEAVLTPRQKELGVCLVNIGAASTSMAVFEEGDVLQTSLLPIGSEHITSDIAIGLRISVDVAETIKIKYGSANPKEIDANDMISLQELGTFDDESIKRQYISEIIEARVEEIFEKVDEQLKKISRSGMLPAGVVICGGGAKLPGILEVAKRKLRLPVTLGYSQDIQSAVDSVKDLSLMTCLGLVMWGNHLQNGYKKAGFMSKIQGVDKISNQVKKWFKALLP